MKARGRMSAGLLFFLYLPRLGKPPRGEDPESIQSVLLRDCGVARG